MLRGERRAILFKGAGIFFSTVYTSNSYEAGLQLKYCKVTVFMFGCLFGFSTFSFLFFLLFLGISIFHYTVLNFKKQ